MELKFGFMREEDQITWSSGVIKPLTECKSTIAALDASGRTCDGWLYPPLVDALGEPPMGMPHPKVHAKVFELASTHRITVTSGPQEPDYVNFIIGLFGLLKGLRLVPEGWNHFYRVPTQCRKLNDFRAGNSSIAKTLELGTEFWLKNNDPKVRQGIFVAIHWHLFGQLYEHQFEQFNAQYIVLDSCFALHNILSGDERGNHGERPSIMCAAYELSLPLWVQLGSNSKKYPIADLRNRYFHEGIYGGAPIGFAHSTEMPSIDLELTAFNARLILAIIGVRNYYTRSPVNNGQYYNFDL